jgi:hypothetical protein
VDLNHLTGTHRPQITFTSSSSVLNLSPHPIFSHPSLSRTQKHKIAMTLHSTLLTVGILVVFCIVLFTTLDKTDQADLMNPTITSVKPSFQPPSAVFDIHSIFASDTALMSRILEEIPGVDDSHPLPLPYVVCNTDTTLLGIDRLKSISDFFDYPQSDLHVYQNLHNSDDATSCYPTWTPSPLQTPSFFTPLPFP